MRSKIHDKLDQNKIIEVKMTKALIDVTKWLVFDISKINHKGLRPVNVQLGSR